MLADVELHVGNVLVVFLVGVHAPDVVLLAEKIPDCENGGQHRMILVEQSTPEPIRDPVFEADFGTGGHDLGPKGNWQAPPRSPTRPGAPVCSWPSTDSE